MASYNLTPAARDDLADIWAYSVERWGVKRTTDYVREIEAACAGAADGSRPTLSAENIRSGYSKVRAGRHIIFFRSNDGSIDVIRILHDSRDLPGVLRN